MAVGEFALPANGTSSGGTYSKVLREYTTSGTWTKPSGLKFIEILCVGGGGGGASGGRQATNAVARGGGGGGGGGVTYKILLDSELGSTESYTIGSGAGGGAAVVVDSTVGNGGGTGGDLPGVVGQLHRDRDLQEWFQCPRRCRRCSSGILSSGDGLSFSGADPPPGKALRTLVHPGTGTGPRRSSRLQP